MRLSIVGTAVLLMAAGPGLAEEPVPQGGEFQVNTFTLDWQSRSGVAADDQGNFVVVWQSVGSSGTDSSGRSIQGQRFDASGAGIGGQFQVNTYTTGDQMDPSVARDPQGDFVVVWGSPESSGSIQGQRIAANGTGIGPQFQVNSYTIGGESKPAVDIDAQGNFVVVWRSNGSPGTDTDWSVQGQRFDANGAPVGGQFQVNTYTTNYQMDGAVAVGSQGNFVVVWGSLGSSGTDTDYFSVQGQRYDASGTPVGGQFQVNTSTTGRQRNPRLDLGAQGEFVVVWGSETSAGTDTSGTSVQGQRYDATGTPAGGEFQVNSYTTGYQTHYDIAIDSRGDFVMVWGSAGSYGTDTGGSVEGQRYDADGTPVGGEFQVNTYTTSGQGRPRIDFDPQGNFVVVWESDGSFGTDTDRQSIQGQRFALPVFTDGFESGDTSAWSNAMP